MNTLGVETASRVVSFAFCVFGSFGATRCARDDTVVNCGIIVFVRDVDLKECEEKSKI
jgi:hypothetical protein